MMFGAMSAVAGQPWEDLGILTGGAAAVCLERIALLTQEQLRDLGAGHFLAEGGSAPSGRWCLKGLLESSAIVPLLREARLMLELNGVGGVPRLRAVCAAPPALLQEYVGITYDNLLKNCSIQNFLHSLTSICERLQEVHAKDILHNDLKFNNITYTGTIAEPVFHIINLGWACHSGQAAAEHVFPDSVYSDEEEDEYEGAASDERHSWMATENGARRPVFCSGDVYSLGYILDIAVWQSNQTFLTEPLMKVSRLCTAKDSARRPALRHVAMAVTFLLRQLTPHQLRVTFVFEVRSPVLFTIGRKRLRNLRSQPHPLDGLLALVFTTGPTLIYGSKKMLVHGIDHTLVNRVGSQAKLDKDPAEGRSGATFVCKMGGEDPVATATRVHTASARTSDFSSSTQTELTAICMALDHGHTAHSLNTLIVTDSMTAIACLHQQAGH
ncbi:hypothetical protein GWK47_042900 [Chionoecetes opilio]|uniref:Protein kinase domain-containing protein n=1 Tax=Chionoecetes opilio TaxID=41210 RepID=A0A8J4YHH9_CHIOP|nr:hypothetical protein GWK47_042900 [Chionoecetes opilio]